MVLSAMSSFPSVSDMLNRSHKLTLILRDIGKNPLKNIPYEIRNLNDQVIKRGTTDGQGQIKLEHQAGVRLNLYLQLLKQGKMQKHKEFTTQPRDGSVIWTTSLLVTETELKPEGSAGEYWRGTYEVKKGDTLTSIAKHYGTRISTLLELNPSIKDKDEISVGAILRVPPNKQSNDRNSERRNPPKPINQQFDKETYQVRRGDTLTGIAKNYRISTDAIMKANPAIRNEDKITEGQILRIPTENAGQQNTPQTKPPVVQTEKTQQTPTASIQTGPGSQQTIPSRAGQTTPQNANGSRSSTRPLPSKIGQQSDTQKVSVGAQPIRQIESTNKDGNAVTTLSPECICKQSQLIWGAKVDCKFRKKVIEIAAYLWGESAKFDKANMLMAVFAWESGGTFATDVPNIKDSGGTGLIQIMPSTYEILFKRKPTLVKTKKYYNKSLTVIKELADMTALQYLDVVKKYFMPLKGKNIDFVDLYLQVLFPASSGRGEHTVFAKSKDLLDVTDHADLRVEKFSRNNMDGFYLDGNGNLHKDGNKDGKVMKSEIAAAVEHYRIDGRNYRSDYKDHEGGAIATNAGTSPINYQQAAQKGLANKSECKDGCSLKSEDSIIPKKIIVIDPGHGIIGGNSGTQIRLLRLRKSFGSADFIVGHLYSWSQLPETIINNANTYLAFVENRDTKYPTEAEYAFQQAVLLKEKLESVGHTVYLTRDTQNNEYVNQVNLVQSLKILTRNPISYRGQIANAVKADYLISLHCDGSATNLEVDHAKILYKYSEPTDRSLTLCNEIKKAYTQIPGRVLSDMQNNPNNLLGVLSESIAARYKVLIEMGYMTTPKHMKILIENSHVIVQNIFDGIQNHIKNFNQ